MSASRPFSYLFRYRWRYLTGFAALVGASVVVMLPPVVLRYAIDDLSRGVGRLRLAELGLLIVALGLVEGSLRFAARHLVSGTSRRVEAHLRDDLLSRLLTLDQSFYIRSQTGDLLARCTNDLLFVRDIMGPSLIELGRTLVMMLLGLVFLLTIDVRLALISLAFLPPLAAVLVYCQFSVEARYRAVQDQFGQLSNRVQENLAGIRTIKAYALEDAETAAFARANEEMRRRSMSWARYTSALGPLMGLAAGFSVVIVLWFGGRDVMAGRITLGQFVQFNTYLAILVSPLTSLGWAVTSLQQGLASLTRVSEILVREPRVDEPRDPVELSQVGGEIELHSVTFGYGDRKVLDKVSLRIPAGTNLAIVGATGSGKTTLVNLLLRLYDPWSGQIMIDGIDLRRLPLAQLRSIIGVVPQEAFLFSETLRENIMPAESTDADQLDYAVEASQLAADLPRLSAGLDTPVGERGATLSGGQRQRATLARTIVRRPPLLLLDDALSHVDTETEERILSYLADFMRGRTTVTVAHRTATLRGTDMIAVLHNGEFVEVGTHRELLMLDGRYARFYRRQLLVEEVAVEAQREAASVAEAAS